MKKLKIHPHISRSVIAAISVLVILMGVTYFLEYRTNQLLKLIVENQSNGLYQLNSDDLDISFFNKSAVLTNATISQPDDSATATKFQLNFPELKLQIVSWSQLIFEKKITIANLSLQSPSFEIRVEVDSAPGNSRVSSKVILEGLKNIVTVLSMQQFSVSNGSFIFHIHDSTIPFEINHIDCKVTNFNLNEINEGRFLLADEIDISIPEQKWKLNNGAHEILFKQLHFNSRNKYFQLDSCKFISFGISRDTLSEFGAAKISFTSDSLSSIYESGDIILDTLFCSEPIIKIHTTTASVAQDSASSIYSLIKNLNTNISIAHLKIENGQLAVASIVNGKTSNYKSEKTNLRIDGLVLRPNDSLFLTTKNIDFHLKYFELFTADGLYELTMENFDLLNDEIRFSNAVFKPASNNSKHGSFKVVIPVLALHKLKLRELFEKRLGAESAEMYSPSIFVEAEIISKNKKTTGNLSNFYDALHGLSEILRVNILQIKNATINYAALNNDSLSATLKHLNTSVLLNNFLNSSSLLDIKHSIPLFQAAQVEIHSKSFNAALEDFHLHGEVQPNGISKINIELPDGDNFEAENFYWHKLNWDSLILSSAIILDSVNIEKFALSSEVESKNKQAVEKKFPAIKIRMFSVENFKINYHQAGENSLSAKGKNILVQNVATGNNLFKWTKASGDLTSLKYAATSIRASADKIQFEFPGKTKVNDLHVNINKQTTNIDANFPEVKFKTSILSTDFSNLIVQSMNIDRPDVDISLGALDSGSAATINFPIELSIDELKVNKAQIKYSANDLNDTINLSSQINLYADSFLLHKNNPVICAFKNMQTEFKNLSFSNNKVAANSSLLYLNLLNGNLLNENKSIDFKSTMDGTFSNSGFEMKNKNQQNLYVLEVNGTIASMPVELGGIKKITVDDWVAHTSISSGKIIFSDSTKLIAAENILWNPWRKTITIDSISVNPKLTPLQFFRTSIWQSDYISVKNGSVAITDFDFLKWRNDSVLTAQKITFTNFDLAVYRDKRIPFQHGIEKAMPTKLLQAVNQKFNIDSVIVDEGNIEYHEFSDLTGREGIVPITNINTKMLNVKNVGLGINDTLIIRGKAQLMDSKIKKFRYYELYSDSLSSFNLAFRTTSFPITNFSKITTPLAGVEVSDGNCDTVIVRMSGNKYASAGQMQFYYHNLKINLLDHQDTLAKRITLSFANFVANSFVVNEKNNDPSTIFYIRDSEKFVFNYWVKSILSGALSGAGIKSNRKYKKQYQKTKKQYSLPPVDF